MNINLHTPFSTIYEAFLSRITDDMYMELNEIDTYRILQNLLLAAISKFEFPRVDLYNYTLQGTDEISTYSGVDSEGEEVETTIYAEGYFNTILNDQEVGILATYMIVEWLGQQLASVENTRMKYSGLGNLVHSLRN